MILYKLTDQNRQTGHGHTVTTWRKGFRPSRLSGEGLLCGSGWYHAYDTPLLAVLHNSIHAGFLNPRCCTVEVVEQDTGRLDGQIKVGFTTGLVTSWIALPEVTLDQRVRYAILCSLKASYLEPAYLQWAVAWWDGTDKSVAAAESAAWAAEWAAAELDLVVLSEKATDSSFQVEELIRDFRLGGSLKEAPCENTL